jgi:hypothetical protein
MKKEKDKKKEINLYERRYKYIDKKKITKR